MVTQSKAKIFCVSDHKEHWYRNDLSCKSQCSLEMITGSSQDKSTILPTQRNYPKLPRLTAGKGVQNGWITLIKLRFERAR